MPITCQIPYSPRYPNLHERLEASRFCVLVAHRRFGKTVLSVNHIIKQAITSKLANPHYGYVAPFRNQAKSVAWDYLKRYTAKLPNRLVNESDLSVSFPCPAGGLSRIRIFGADNPDALRGLYFDGIVLDEVAQMKKNVWSEIIQPALSDRMGWALFIGTPKGINMFSELYYGALEKSQHGDKNWLAMLFQVYDTSAILPAEVQRLKAEMGDNHFRQEYLCDFTASADNTLISIDEAMAAMERTPDKSIIEQWPQVIGVDVARFGDDLTVFFRRQGPKAYEPIVIRQEDSCNIASKLLIEIEKHKAAYVCIDQGQGTGVIDFIRRLAPSFTNIIEVPFGSRALAPDKFVNRRAEIWFKLREWIRADGAIPKGNDLLAELTAPLYDFDAASRIRLEKKEEIKKRLSGKSTDFGDALALTFAVNIDPLTSRREILQKAWLGQNREAAQAWDIFQSNQSQFGADFDPFQSQGSRQPFRSSYDNYF